MKLTITLPLPPKELSPNYTVGSRGQRLGKAAKTKKYRKHACEETQIATGAFSNRAAWYWPAAEVQCTFYYKDTRRRDKDNALASMKAAFDGIADAGLVGDDSALTYLPVKMLKSKENPRVEIEITRKEVGPKE
jgi:Holliday junction resolvase RusA-like endonuclease